MILLNSRDGFAYEERFMAWDFSYRKLYNIVGELLYGLAQKGYQTQGVFYGTELVYPQFKDLV